MYTTTLHFDSSQTILAPFGDVQVGAPYAKDTCARYLDKAFDAYHHGTVYFIGMGDYVDVTNPSSRRALRGARLADSLEQALEEKAEEHIEEFIELVKGTKGRWLGFLTGHHYFNFEDGSTSDTRIAEALGAPAWGSSALVRMLFPEGYSLNMLAFHGEGGSTLPSGALRKLETTAPGFEADLVLMGHHHKLAVSKRDSIYYDSIGTEIAHRTQTLVCTGSFVKGYVEGKGTYVERKMLVPVTLGGALVYVDGAEVSVEI